MFLNATTTSVIAQLARNLPSKQAEHVVVELHLFSNAVFDDFLVLGVITILSQCNNSHGARCFQKN